MFSNPNPKGTPGISSVFNYPIIDTLKLIKFPDLEPINFWDVVKNRKSTRVFSELSLDKINKVLWASAKVKEIFVQDDGYVLTRRPSASAGARHPIDIIIQSPILDDIETFYYYNPFVHSLNKLRLKDKLIREFRNHVSSILNLNQATIMWFIAHPVRTEVKYDNSSSLIWRDAGALIHSIQLVCTGLGINSCAVGSLGEPFISGMFADYGNVYGVGGIVIG